jgi:hypothetical protein
MQPSPHSPLVQVVIPASLDGQAVQRVPHEAMSPSLRHWLPQR